MKIHELITEDTWARGSYALDVNNHPTQTYAKNAVRWCAMGWLRKVYNGEVYNNCLGFRTIVEKVQTTTNEELKRRNLILLHNSISYFNDHPTTTFEDIKLLFIKANV